MGSTRVICLIIHKQDVFYLTVIISLHLFSEYDCNNCYFSYVMAVRKRDQRARKHYDIS